MSSLPRAHPSLLPPSRIDAAAAAMERVGGGEKQLEDCTVSKSVTPFAFALCVIDSRARVVRSSPRSRFAEAGTPVSLVVASASW